MNFQQRFKGKTSVIDKEGIEGVVKSKALPIQKEFSSDNSDIPSYQNSKVNQVEQNQDPAPFKPIKTRKTQSHQASTADLQQLSNANEKQKTKIVTNIRQPSDISSANSLNQSKINERGSVKLTPSSSSTAASSSQFKRYSEQSQFSSSANRKTTDIPVTDIHDNDFRQKIYQQNNGNDQFGLDSIDTYQMKVHRSKLKSAEDYSNIFQNRLQQRVQSGVLHQPAQSFFSTGNYENQFRQFSTDYNNKVDNNPLNYTGTYQLQRGVNQIIVPSDYELIAVPRNQMFSINSPNSFPQMSNSMSTSVQNYKMPMFQSPNSNNSTLNHIKEGNLSQMTPFGQQSFHVYVPDDMGQSNKFANGLSQILSKRNLVNSGKSILESTSNLKTKPPGHSSYRYELDLMEEKHRDIIDNLDKIREIRTKKA